MFVSFCHPPDLLWRVWHDYQSRHDLQEGIYKFSPKQCLPLREINRVMNLNNSQNVNYTNGI